MANSNSIHSKNLRIEHSKKWTKENIKTIRILLVPKNYYLIEEFNAIEGSTKNQKLKTLIEFYNNHKGQQK